MQRVTGKEEKAAGIKKNNQEHVPVVRVQREKIRSGRKKDKRFEGEGGAGMLH